MTRPETEAAYSEGMTDDIRLRAIDDTRTVTVKLGQRPNQAAQ